MQRLQRNPRSVLHQGASDEPTADAGLDSGSIRGDGNLHKLNDAPEPIEDLPATAPGQEPILFTPEFSDTPSPRLPQELIDHIISFLWKSRHVMDVCKLVSRPCYSYVSTYSGILRLSSAEAFSVLSHSPTAAEQLRDVHHLRLLDSATPWVHRVPLRLGRALANVTSLYLIDWSPARMPLHPAVLPAFAHLRGVSSLHLYDCRFESVAQLKRLIGAFPGLRKLELCGVYVPAHKAFVSGASGVVCRPPPRLTYLALGSSHRKKPEQGEANVAGALAAWFSKDRARLHKLHHLFVRTRYAYLQDGELSSIGDLVAAVGHHISQLELDFAGVRSDLRDHIADLGSLRLDSCVRVHTLAVHRSSPELHELALLPPYCRIKSLYLAQGTWYRSHQSTNWAALATALKHRAYNELKRVCNNARIPQSPAEGKALQTFIARMHARGIKFTDRTEFPFLHDK